MDIKFDFGLAFEAMSDKVDKLHKSFLDSRPARPRYFTQRGQASSAASATTPFQIDLGGPPVGFMWDIMGVVCYGSDDHTTVAGNVAIYAGNIGNPSLNDVLITPLTIPSYSSIGKDRVFVQPGLTMYANVSGVANSTLVTLAVHVAEWQQIDKIPQGAP